MVDNAEKQIIFQISKLGLVRFWHENFILLYLILSYLILSYLILSYLIRSSLPGETPSVQALFFRGAQGSNKMHQNSLAQIH